MSQVSQDKIQSSVEEIAASSDVIVSALNEVKKKLNLLIE